MRRLGWISLGIERDAMTTLQVVREGEQRDGDGAEPEKGDTR